MRTLIETTGKDFLNKVGSIKPIGKSGDSDLDAYETINEFYEDNLSFLNKQWCDMMEDENGNVYAVYATDELSNPDATVLYVKY